MAVFIIYSSFHSSLNKWNFTDFSLVVTMSMAMYVCMYVWPLPLQFILGSLIGQQQSYDNFPGLSLDNPPQLSIEACPNT